MDPNLEDYLPIQKSTHLDVYSEEETKTFVHVKDKIAKNVEEMIFNLNRNWKLLGEDDATRFERNNDLVNIIQEHIDAVVEETSERVKSDLAKIKAMHEEFLHLSESLNVILDTQYDAEETLNKKIYVLRKDLEGLRDMMTEKINRIKKLNVQHKLFSEALGIVSSSLSISPLPTEETIKIFEILLEEQKHEYENRLQIFKEKRDVIKKLTDDLGLNNLDSFHDHIISCSIEHFRVCDSNMEHLDETKQRLEVTMKKHKSKILEMRSTLHNLWELLEKSSTHSELFLEKKFKNSLEVEAALNEEINRCKAESRINFKMLLDKLRYKIIELWDSCMYSELQRDKFVDFHYDGEYDENIFANHEKYMEKLRIFYENNLTIFTLYNARQKLWKNLEELEKKAHEKDRYNNRGGQLLKEEQQRKTVSKKLPKIEEDLVALAEEYRAKNGEEFTINGYNLIETIQEDWIKRSEEKQKKNLTRKQLFTPKSPLSAPRSAPSSRFISVISKEKLTAVKRNLSPYNTPHPSKCIEKTLHHLKLSPKDGGTVLNRSLRNNMIKKSSVPRIAVNGCILKKKRSVGRLSSELKKKHNHKNRTPSKSPCQNDSTTFSMFQEPLQNQAHSRSSAIDPENINAMYTRSEDLISVTKDYKKIISPKNFNSQSIHELKKKLLPNSTPEYKIIVPHVGSNIKNAISPLSREFSKINKTGAFSRQNTVILASPSARNIVEPLRRSNSFHNIKSASKSPVIKKSTSVKFPSKIDLIM